MRQLLALLVSIGIAIAPAHADFGVGNGTQGFWENNPKYTQTMTRVACVSDTANATTYNSAAFQTISTGLTNTDYVKIVIYVIGLDAATAFSANSATLNGAPLEKSDEFTGSNASLVIISQFRPPGDYVQNVATANFSVTYSEAISSAVVCIWAIKYQYTPDSGGWGCFQTASAACDLNAGIARTTGGFSMAVCANAVTGQTTTWTGITERQDTNNGEVSYTTADDASAGSSGALNCDYTGSGDAIGLMQWTEP